MIIDHRQLSDQEFIGQLENNTLTPGLFNHEAHVRLAWLYLTQMDLPTAIASLSKMISAMDSSGNKYHHTITVTFALLIYKAMRREPVRSWESFIIHNPILRAGKSMLLNWYSEELLANGLSRRIFIPPDKTKVNPELLLHFFEQDGGK